MISDAPQQYPTIAAARDAVVIVAKPMADLFDGHLHIGACPRVHEHSRACVARITGPAPTRLRVTVSLSKDGTYVIVRARPIEKHG